MHLYKRKRGRGALWGIWIMIFLGGLFLLDAAAGYTRQTTREEQAELLQEAVDQAVVSCFCLEGRYPENLDYLVDNYGLQVDFEKYRVNYEIFADNIRPRVRVVRLD